MLPERHERDGRQKSIAGNRQIVSVDSTIIAQAPRMAPHVEAMRANVAAVGLPGGRVVSGSVPGVVAGPAPARFDLVLADPPYATPVEEVLGVQITDAKPYAAAQPYEEYFSEGGANSVRHLGKGSRIWAKMNEEEKQILARERVRG